MCCMHVCLSVFVCAHMSAVCTNRCVLYACVHVCMGVCMYECAVYLCVHLRVGVLVGLHVCTYVRFMWICVCDVCAVR